MTGIPPGRNAKIFFSPRHQTHFEFTNGSDHPINYKNKVYKTAENLYQAMKFIEHQPQIAELLRSAHEPKRLAKVYEDEVRPDWPQIHVSMMQQVLTMKFDLYPGLKKDLLATGEAQLILLSTDGDKYWCGSENGVGRNEFGRALMRVRDSFN